MSPDANELDVSVVICTRNRAGPLAVLLESMTALKIPTALRWELVIVDNGSTDGTAATVDGFIDRLPVVYASEGNAGLSNARNCGVGVARGRYICWTDDDVELDRDWLAAYVDAFRAHPDAAVFGGKVIPKLEGPTPTWFARLLSRWPITDLVAARDFGETPMPLDFSIGLVPWGANYAVRTAEQRRFRYDPELGVSPLQRRSGEETQCVFEILNTGASGWWVPGSRVMHIYPTGRQTRRYLYSHYVAIGEAKAYLDANYPRHYMNRDGAVTKPPNRTRLMASMAFNGALCILFTATGLTLRSLYHLRKLGLTSGALQYLRLSAV